MKKLLIILFASLLLVACDDGIDEIEGEKAEAKTSSDDVEEEIIEEEEQAVEEEGEGSSEETDDIWTYYDNATWEGDFNGLRTEIQKVVVSEKAPTFEDPDAEVSAVGVKFLVENTTDHKFITFPDQATLVTSTGEQVEADLLVSDDIGGDIHEGVIKEGDVFFFLERGEAESIEWIKLEWDSSDESIEDISEAFHTDEVELQLK